MNRYKKYIFIVMTLVLSMSMFACNSEQQNDGKITIMTTLFPQYDFARQIVGDKCEVKLLLPPGTESHSYEPTPKDIIGINNADMLVYTGDAMEAWVATILEGIDNKELNVVDVSEGIELLKTGETEHNHSHDIEADNEDGHDNELDDNAENIHNHEEEEQESAKHYEEKEDEHEADLHHGHSHEIDPHFFTSPKNAVIMMNTILEEIVKLDPANEDFYKKNCESYIAKINEVDERLHHITDEAENNTLYFGGKFAMLYFVNEYHLSYVSPFDSCAHESEANPKSIVEIIECMKEHNANTVFFEELAEPKVAKMIAGEIDGNTLLLHSCHNVSKSEFESGVTYVDLMNQNADNLEKGL